MKLSRSVLVLYALFCCSQLAAQNTSNARQMEVLKVFNAFFATVKAKDTANIRNMVLHPHLSGPFFQQSGFNTEGEPWASQSSLGGYLQTISYTGDSIRHCSNKLEDVSIEIFDRYAIVSAKYKCFTSDSQLDNCGKYTMRLIKNQQWKIEQLYRYTIKDNCTQIGMN